MEMLNDLWSASREVLKENRYRTLTAATAMTMLALYTLLPVVTIPGNSITMQLSITTPIGHLLMAILSLGIGLLVSMQLYIYRRVRSQLVVEASRSTSTSFATVIGAIFGTASCTSCIAAIFPFLSSGAILFLVQYQWAVVLISLTVLFVSLLFAAKRITKTCTTCEVNP